MTGGGDISANREFKVDSSSIVTIATPQTISGIKTFSNEMVLSNVSAPGVTTNKLYATSGRLYWNGFLLDSDAAGGGGGSPYSKSDFDSDFISTMDSAAGKGLVFNAQNILDIDSAEFLAGFEASINHDNLSGFVANEHIDHTGVTLTAGAGITGGGDISANREFKIDSASIATLTTTQTLSNKTFAGFTSTSDASFSATKQLSFTGRSDGSGSIDQLLKLSAGDEYGRPSVSYYDAAARHRAAAAFHERDGTSGSPGSYHDAYEIKTSADPAGGSPSDMRTRLSVGTDADLADVSVNYADNFYVRDGSTTTFAVNTGSGDVTLGDGTNEEVKIDIAGSRSAIGYDLAGGNIVVQGGSGKGISFCTNNATFGSGEVWSITSAGVLKASDAVTGNVMYLGSDNVAREFGISGDRAKFGYSGSETYMEGGDIKGCWPSC